MNAQARIHDRTLTASIVLLVLLFPFGGSGTSTAQQESLQGRYDTAEVIVFSLDGRFILGGCRDGKARIWDLQQNAVVRVLEGSDWAVGTATYSPDGKSVAAASYKGPIKVWNVATGQETWSIADLPGDNRKLAIAPNGQLLAVAVGLVSEQSENQSAYRIHLYDFVQKKAVRLLAQGSGFAKQVAFSPDGKTLAVAVQAASLQDKFKGIRLIDVESGKVNQELADAFAFPLNLAFSPDGRSLAVGLSPGRIPEAEGQKIPGHVKVWDLQTGKTSQVFGGSHDSWYPAVAFSPDGKTIAGGTSGSRVTTKVGNYSLAAINLWDAESGKLLWHKEVQRYCTECIAFSPDGKTIASVDGEGLKLFDSKTGKLLEVVTRWEWRAIAPKQQE